MIATGIRDKSSEYYELNRIAEVIEVMGYTEEPTAVTSTYRLFNRKDKYLALHESTGYFMIFKSIGRSLNPDLPNIDEVIVDWTDKIELIA